MVFLIDDNQNNLRFNNYNITYIENGIFDGYLKSIEKLEIGKNLSDTTHLDFLKKADCILLHSTTEDYNNNLGFIPGSKTNVLRIKEKISVEGEKIPLVLFSNSMGDPEFDLASNPHYIRGMNKNLFYERLNDFLENYKNTGQVELRFIALGKNFASNEILSWATDVLNAIEFNKNSEDLKLSDLSIAIKSFKRFIESSLPTKDINDILNDIEDNPITIGDFKTKIKHIKESYVKYGKNIYNWK